MARLQRDKSPTAIVLSWRAGVVKADLECYQVVCQLAASIPTGTSTSPSIWIRWGRPMPKCLRESESELVRSPCADALSRRTARRDVGLDTTSRRRLAGSFRGRGELHPRIQKFVNGGAHHLTWPKATRRRVLIRQSGATPSAQALAPPTGRAA
ncbi:hypothetical protein Bbelb_168220 [Branchiostoma belcheri]|nr:hypothetical protein Bbelb_168220 [Branchiostoma belcheri]